MRKRARLGLLVALVVVLVAPAAQASRRSALGGNLLIEDAKDIFYFPHDVARYVNYVWFDFMTGLGAPVGDTGSGDPMLGSGGILFGNAADHSFGFGIATHRSDYQNALGAVVATNALFNQTGLGDLFSLLANLGDDDAEPIYDDLVGAGFDALQWIDLLAGFRVSREIDFGARLSVGSNLLSRKDRDGPNEGDVNPGTSFNSFNFLASLGYDTNDGGFSLDAALELNIASLASEALDVTNEGSGFGFALGGRAFFRLAEDIDLGTLAGFEIRLRSTDYDAGAGTDTDVSELAFTLGAGPRYHIAEEATVAAYVTLGVAQRTLDPDGSDNITDAVLFLLPGVNIAAEWWLTDFFAYRAGLVSQYTLASGEQQLPDPTGGSDTAARNLFFYWSNGIGFTALDGDFDFDAMINWPIITDGPYVLSGNSNGMFGMVTAAYTF